VLDRSGVALVRELLLIRRARTGPRPKGTYGRVEVVLPRLYAVVTDPAELALHLYMTGQLGWVGPIPRELEGAVRQSGVKLKKEGEVKMRVFPTAVHAGKDPAEFLWESHLEVVQP
jgi:hypothetical protein